MGVFRNVFIALLIINITLPALVTCSFILQIKFGIFYPVQKVSCDTFTGCDFTFIICVDDPSGGNRLSPCNYRRITTKVFEYEVLDLDKEIGTISVTVNKWTGPIIVKVEVWDYDKTGDNDYIDLLRAEYKGPIGDRRYQIATTGKTRLPVTISTKCSPNYYGPLCDCSPSVSSNYWCSSNGKVCNTGWTGDDCTRRITTTTTTTTTTKATPTTITTMTTTPTTTTIRTTLPLTVTASDDIFGLITTESISNKSIISTTEGNDNQINTTTENLGTFEQEINTSQSNIYNDSETQLNASISENSSVEFSTVNTSWICDKISMSVLLSNATNPVEDITSILSEVFWEHGHFTYDIAINRSSHCYEEDRFYQVEYCVDNSTSLSDDKNLKTSIEHRLLQNDIGFQASVGNCANASKITDTSYNFILLVVLGCILTALIITAAVVVIVNHKRKQRTEEISKLQFTYKYCKEEPRVPIKVIEEELIHILDD